MKRAAQAWLLKADGMAVRACRAARGADMELTFKAAERRMRTSFLSATFVVVMRG
jgi:hypothetical protein